MRSEGRRQLIITILLGALCLAALLYLSGLAATLPLGDAGVRGFLLVPALPMPLYLTMLGVVLAAVGLSLLVSILQRRRRSRAPEPQRESEAPKPFWQSMLTTLAWVALVGVGLNWFIRHGQEVQDFLERVRTGVGALRESLGSGTLPLVDQVSSPTAGYMLFVIIVVIYGGIALVALWVLFEDGAHGRGAGAAEDPQLRQVRRAMQAGLRELREHTDPRQAIIACYARLEYLLEDHGVPAYHHLTPQEYMGAALQGLDLPQDAFAGLIRLFELARYSLHPLDDMARSAAIGHLEQLTAHVEGSPARAAHD
jgi:NADH:ubiquinone oxidoreductase subunit 5 (subunit L)/multisubunit Na+/H+ antiporter MnhA subunit